MLKKTIYHGYTDPDKEQAFDPAIAIVIPLIREIHAKGAMK